MAGADRYDELHSIGHEQARRLGRHWGDRAVHLDAIYTGPLARQRETFAHMKAAAGEAGAAWPEPIVLTELAEAPLEALARHCMTERLASDTALQKLVRDLAAGTHGPDEAKIFEALLGHVVDVWLSGDVTLPGVESPAEFGQRVRSALDRILGAATERAEIAVVTSNGVIGWLAGYAEDELVPEERCLRRRLFNASVTRFVVSQGRIRLDAWNVIEHLSGGELQTLL